MSSSNNEAINQEFQKHSIILDAKRLEKSYHDGLSTVHILNKVSLSVEKGEQIAVIGPSGSGKSTLLHLLGGLEKPSAGEIHLMNQNIWQCSEKKRSQLRNRSLGFIYQFHHLLPEFTALENVMMPLLLGNASFQNAKERAQDLLEKVGLKERLTHKPSQLSGGERQRVAIADRKSVV